MAYKANIPQANDFISVSQADIQENFTQLGMLLSPANGGLNALKFVAGAAPATGATQVSLYCKNDGAGDPALYYRPKNSGAEVALAFTNVVVTPHGGILPDEYSFTLPGGIIVKLGQGNFVGGDDMVNFVFADPFPNKAFFAWLSMHGAPEINPANNPHYDSRDYIFGNLCVANHVTAWRDSLYKGAPFAWNFIAIGN